MELVKNIFFNTDKLTQNSNVKISYTGKFFQDGSKEVYIHYGFGLLWENIGEIKMQKTELGFQADIELAEYDSFNFCFKNENDCWDNNDGANYIFQLEAVSNNLVRIDELNTTLNAPRKLRKSYLISKKVRIAIYKIITVLPKIISGNYKRKINNEN